MTGREHLRRDPTIDTDVAARPLPLVRLSGTLLSSGKGLTPTSTDTYDSTFLYGFLRAVAAGPGSYRPRQGVRLLDGVE